MLLCYKRINSFHQEKWRQDQFMDWCLKFKHELDAVTAPYKKVRLRTCRRRQSNWKSSHSSLPSDPLPPSCTLSFDHLENFQVLYWCYTSTYSNHSLKYQCECFCIANHFNTIIFLVSFVLLTPFFLWGPIFAQCGLNSHRIFEDWKPCEQQRVGYKIRMFIVGISCGLSNEN